MALSPQHLKAALLSLKASLNQFGSLMGQLNLEGWLLLRRFSLSLGLLLSHCIHNFISSFNNFDGLIFKINSFYFNLFSIFFNFIDKIIKIIIVKRSLSNIKWMQLIKRGSIEKHGLGLFSLSLLWIAGFINIWTK
jgi:hypothetical protein